MTSSATDDAVQVATPRRLVAPRCCSVPRSSPPSPTSTRATSPPTSPPARATATCCCGCSSRRTPWPCSSSTSPRSSAWSPATRCRGCSGSGCGAARGWRSGCRPRWSRRPPTSPRSSAAPSPCNLLFGVPLPLGGLIVGVVSLLLLATQNRYGQRRFEHVIVGAARRHHRRVPGRAVRRRRPTPAASCPVWSRGSTAPTRSCSPPRCSARPSCRTRSTCTRPSPATATAAPPGSTLRELLRSTRWDVGVALAIAGVVNIGLLLLAASGPARRPRHRLDPRRLRRDRRRAGHRHRRSRSPSACSRRAWRPPRSAPTRARRSWRG